MKRFVIVACTLMVICLLNTSCKMGSHSSYNRAVVAQYIHPDARPMQIANMCICDHWPQGVDISIYCNDKLVAQLKPRDDTMIIFPAEKFILKVVARNKRQEEIAVLRKKFETAEILPCWAVRYAAFIDPKASPGVPTDA